ncbi:hypothetical protein KEC55_32320 [Burkholderia cepacia]|nr:hypothetical protein [Burkholderia cepacia]WGY73644.1 hypothetical protein KEC55_32320 [Burkholderia cepacia]
MSRTPDRSQRVAELEHALANGFPSQSAVVVHTDHTSGRLTIQVSWVREPTDEGVRAWRCTSRPRRCRVARCRQRRNEHADCP